MKNDTHKWNINMLKDMLISDPEYPFNWNFLIDLFEDPNKKTEKVITTNIELRPVELSPEYREKWNVHSTDYCNIYKDGVKISDTLYRKGGMSRLGEGDEYSMILKCPEAYYEDNITKDKKKKRHLENQSVIVDKNGIEKVNFDNYDSPYLQGGLIYSLNSKYYNIETGELYCDAHTSMKTEEFIFLDNKYDKDKSKRGVMKINKFNGTFELFKEKMI